MDEKYQNEIDDFSKNFERFKNKKIVLYGIGRYTATLIAGTNAFDFVGLMDKDPKNVGKAMFGLPIIDKEDAYKIADIIIINTSETYWEIISQRLSDSEIPVYYKNGVLAKKKGRMKKVNPFCGLSYKMLASEIEKHDVISFDFFDTLFSRKVFEPSDVFKLLENEIKDEWKCDESFIEIRNRAKSLCKKIYSFDELYEKIAVLSNIPRKEIEKIERKEWGLELKLLTPRNEMIKALYYAVSLGKEVYIVSDMYFPKTFFYAALEKYCISFDINHIIVSCEKMREKIDGSLWEYYSKEILNDKTALHIGDNKVADIDVPKKFGIDGFFVPSINELMQISNISQVRTFPYDVLSSLALGIADSHLFSNPFSLNDSNQKVSICNFEEMGYVIFGPVILSFLVWLVDKSCADNVNKLVFMSRDGYFLKEDFDFFLNILGIEKPNCYIGISRQLAMYASIYNKTELLDYANMPYSGNVKELFEDRFGILISENTYTESIEEIIDIYYEEIMQKIAETRDNYLHYLNEFKLDCNCAIVDLGYYGNNQKYLNRFLDLHMKGYYFNADLSTSNPNVFDNQMKACFQNESDKRGLQSQILKKMILLESFLTAPYGMVKAIDIDNSFICAKSMNNQINFSNRVKINNGVKAYISDYFEIAGNDTTGLNCMLVDAFYGICLDGNIDFSEGIKNIFYNDNAMMNRIESSLFH